MSENGRINQACTEFDTHTYVNVENFQRNVSPLYSDIYRKTSGQISQVDRTTIVGLEDRRIRSSQQNVVLPELQRTENVRHSCSSDIEGERSVSLATPETIIPAFLGVRIPRFVARKNDVRKFFIRLENYFKQYPGLTDETKVGYLVNVICDDSLDFLVSLPEYQDDDFGAIKIEFLEHYQDEIILSNTWANLVKRRQDSNESCTQFYDALCKLGVGLDISANQWLRIFVSGLREKTKEFILLQQDQPEDIKKALRLAKKFEALVNGKQLCSAVVSAREGDNEQNGHRFDHIEGKMAELERVNESLRQEISQSLERAERDVPRKRETDFCADTSDRSRFYKPKGLFVGKDEGVSKVGISKGTSQVPFSGSARVFGRRSKGCWRCNANDHLVKNCSIPRVRKSVKISSGEKSLRVHYRVSPPVRTHTVVTRKSCLSSKVVAKDCSPQEYENGMRNLIARVGAVVSKQNSFVPARYRDGRRVNFGEKCFPIPKENMSKISEVASVNADVGVTVVPNNMTKISGVESATADVGVTVIPDRMSGDSSEDIEVQLMDSSKTSVEGSNGSLSFDKNASEGYLMETTIFRPFEAKLVKFRCGQDFHLTLREISGNLRISLLGLRLVRGRALVTRGQFSCIVSNMTDYDIVVPEGTPLVSLGAEVLNLTCNGVNKDVAF